MTNVVLNQDITGIFYLLLDLFTLTIFSISKLAKTLVLKIFKAHSHCLLEVIENPPKCVCLPSLSLCKLIV